MKKTLILLAFLTTFFVSYGKTNFVDSLSIQEFSELPRKTPHNLITDVNPVPSQAIIEILKKNLPSSINQISRNFYEFEVTTSCGPVISVIQYCDCDYWQLMSTATNIGLAINQQACPDDTPGSQHVRIIMP